MKNKGFTLAEVLITLAAIGVVTAIMAPIIGGLIPDKNKSQVMRLSKVINEINSDLLHNPSLYFSANTSCNGFACQQQPLDSPYNTDAKYVGAKKYPYLLADSLQITTDPEVSGSAVTFQTVDGILWSVESSTSGKAAITVDLNGDTLPNSIYSATCKKPDRFRFLISASGHLLPGDALTEAYFKNPTKLNDKKNDKKNADNSKIDYTLAYEQLINLDLDSGSDGNDNGNGNSGNYKPIDGDLIVVGGGDDNDNDNNNLHTGFEARPGAGGGNGGSTGGGINNGDSGSGSGGGSTGGSGSGRWDSNLGGMFDSVGSTDKDNDNFASNDPSGGVGFSGDGSNHDPSIVE